MQMADHRLRGLFEQGPTSIVLPQGNVSSQQISQAWAEGQGPVYDSLFVSWSLHQQLTDARSAGERVEEANLSSQSSPRLLCRDDRLMLIRSYGDGNLGPRARSVDLCPGERLVGRSGPASGADPSRLDSRAP